MTTVNGLIQNVIIWCKQSVGRVGVGRVGHRREEGGHLCSDSEFACGAFGLNMSQ